MVHLDDDTGRTAARPRRGDRGGRRRVRRLGSRRGRYDPAGPRSSASGRWPARWPPSCRRSAAARSTPRRTAVHVPQRAVRHRRHLLCTLDGDASPRCAPRPPAHWRSDTRCAVGRSPDDGRPRSAPDARAGTHLEMLAAELPGSTEVRICGPAARGGRGAGRAGPSSAGIPADLSATTPSTAVDGADVIVTVTQSTVAAVPGERRVGDGALICAVGATKYDRAEIGPTSSPAARPWCATTSPAAGECGDLIRAAAAGAFDWAGAIELHAVAAGTATSSAGAGDAPGPVRDPGRRAPRRRRCAASAYVSGYDRTWIRHHDDATPIPGRPHR